MHWFFAAQGLSLGTGSGATLCCGAWFSLWWALLEQRPESRPSSSGAVVCWLSCPVAPFQTRDLPCAPAVAVNSWPLDHQGNPELLTVSLSSPSLCPSHPLSLLFGCPLPFIPLSSSIPSSLVPAVQSQHRVLAIVRGFSLLFLSVVVFSTSLNHQNSRRWSW